MKKKLIEVALPLQAINEGSRPETENPFLKGHPRAIHNWWARTPLSVSRAILFAQLIDDPANDLPALQARERRQELLDFVARLATWDATDNDELLSTARQMVLEQFGGNPPEFWDMFAGRASIPLEAQRLGLKVTSSDVNPVSVTIQRALLEFPPTFRGRPPVHPDQRNKLGITADWKGASGLAADVRHYGRWVAEQASLRLKDIFPSETNGGVPVAWLWARTVQCPNPACNARMPMVRSFWLSKKKGRKHYAQPILDREKKTVRFEIRVEGQPEAETVNRIGARCLFCGQSITKSQLRDLSVEHGLQEIPLAVVCNTRTGLCYTPFDPHKLSPQQVRPLPSLDQPMTNDRRWFSPPLYGLPRFEDIFTPRQLSSLAALLELIQEARAKIVQDASGDGDYADAVALYLACALSRMTDYHNSLTTWNPTNENVSHLFQRQAIPMAWDYCEANLIQGKLSFDVAAQWVAGALSNVPADGIPARVCQVDARKNGIAFDSPPIISTDPPYYDNISYAALADFFYVWLRPALRSIDSTTFATVLTPKEPELIASVHRHGSAESAESHFREGFSQVFENLREWANPDVPITIYYAFKQEESEEDEGSGEQRASTGWETMLEGLINARFQITGTWPVRTTKKARSVARGTNALASAVVLVARRRSVTASVVTRREFVSVLKKELPSALAALTQASIAPVDLAQATIGPGMAVFSRYARVLEATGLPMSVRSALALINQALDEVLAEQEGEFDADTRWAVAWFEQHGVDDGAFGDADVLARAKNTSVQGLVNAGIIVARAGRVRLLRRDELPVDWDPGSDQRVTVWEITQHLIRALLDQGSEQRTAQFLRQVGVLGEVARDLAYRLYGVCERAGWTQEALAYNSLVVAWPVLRDLAQSLQSGQAQAVLDLEE